MEDDKGWPMTDADNRKKMDHTATIRYTYTNARAWKGGAYRYKETGCDSTTQELHVLRAVHRQYD